MPEAIQSSGLSSMSRERLLEAADKLARGYQRMKTGAANAKRAAEKPAVLLVQELAGVSGAAMSGVIHGFTPTTHKFQAWDGVVGVPVMLLSLWGAGTPAGDGAAFLGLGLAAPALSRIVSEKIHAKRGK
jgi:hypothetical protein